MKKKKKEYKIYDEDFCDYSKTIEENSKESMKKNKHNLKIFKKLGLK